MLIVAFSLRALRERWLAEDMRSRPVLLVAATLLAAGCSSSAAPAAGPTAKPAPVAASSAAGTADSSAAHPATSPAAMGAAGSTVWICRPDATPNPCTKDLDATVATSAGTTKAAFVAPAAPPADCFYVYPTVSQAPGNNAPRATAPDIESAVHAQAGLFSGVCRLFVPVYRQVTLRALAAGQYTDPTVQAIAYGDVRDAWHDYLAHDNGGRPVVLIGHSQGAMLLTRLIAAEIDPVAGVRAHLLSAILLGGNVTARAGADSGGSFTHIPACGRPGQTGCVIAYSSFATAPPSFALFGRATQPGQSVLCTDPTLLAGSAGLAHPYVPTDRVTGGPAALPGTGFVAYPAQLRVSCRTGGGATWLQVTPVPGAVLPAFDESLGPVWGLHVADVTLALGDLVKAVGRQETARAAG